MNQRKEDAKAIAKRRKAATVCAKKLTDAATSLKELLIACRACNDGSGDEKRGISDGRYTMMNNLREYATYLEGQYSILVNETTTKEQG